MRVFDVRGGLIFAHNEDAVSVEDLIEIHDYDVNKDDDDLETDSDGVKYHKYWA